MQQQAELFALIASQLVLPPHWICCSVLPSSNNHPLPLADQRRSVMIRNKRAIFKASCNKNLYNRSCCTSRCKARVAIIWI